MCSGFLLTGVLATLARLFKHGERSVMLPLAPSLWQHLKPLSDEPAIGKSLIARKLLAKLAQRLALTLLDPTAVSSVVLATRAARRRGGTADSQPAHAAQAAVPAAQSSFQDHTGTAVPARSTAQAGQQATHPLGSDEEVLALTREGLVVVPDTIDALLLALRDQDTVVRWSAAKGLGRIAARLPARCAADVVDALLLLFSEYEMDSAWQGASLALAEVVRRGLLPAQRLPEVRTRTQVTLCFTAAALMVTPAPPQTPRCLCAAVSPRSSVFLQPHLLQGSPHVSLHTPGHPTHALYSAFMRDADLLPTGMCTQGSAAS